MTFSEWAYQHVVKENHEIYGIKDDDTGENVAWMDTTSKEMYYLSNGESEG